MQKLNTLWQLVNAASTVRDFAQHTRSYYFSVGQEVTFYLHTQHADIHIVRWQRPIIEVRTRLQAAFGWRIASDQDEAGVYMAARRRSVVGELSSGNFEVMVPYYAYLILKIEHGALTLAHINSTVHIPPAQDGTLHITPGNGENTLELPE